MTEVPDPYQRYWSVVEELLGSNPRHKSTAIRLSGAPVVGWNGRNAVERLFTAMNGDFWLQPMSRTDSNWMWRDTVPPASEASIEVGLERCVAEQGGREDWTCQMPTLSGYLGASASKRRSIDLVQRVATERYRFIELKIGSDNPVYAAFELLGYALTYLRVRQSGRASTGQHHVLAAKSLELVVLAPKEWYFYRRERGGQDTSVELGWLADSLASGMTEFSGLDAQFRFESFTWAGDKADAAMDIHAKLA